MKLYHPTEGEKEFRLAYGEPLPAGWYDSPEKFPKAAAPSLSGISPQDMEALLGLAKFGAPRVAALESAVAKLQEDLAFAGIRLDDHDKLFAALTTPAEPPAEPAKPQEPQQQA